MGFHSVLSLIAMQHRHKNKCAHKDPCKLCVLMYKRLKKKKNRKMPDMNTICIFLLNQVSATHHFVC